MVTDVIDWTKSMKQTYEFYRVNPIAWTDDERIWSIKSCTINRDMDDETLGSATFDGLDMEGEFYIRVYLIAFQNGKQKKEPLGTFLIQTSVSSFTGKQNTLKIEAYTPLIELKEKYPPVGYALMNGDDILKQAYKLTETYVRAPVVYNDSSMRQVKAPMGFVAELEESWLKFIEAMLKNVDMNFDLDPMGNILFRPNVDFSSMQAVFTYTDDNSSILYPEISMDYDLYNVPNVVEVVISVAGGYYTARVVNDDEWSDISTVRRGREVVYRVHNPSDLKTQNALTSAGKLYANQYATNLLKELSTIQRTINYVHGYCGVRVGDCVRINYKRAGMTNIRAVVVSQSIQCTPGCPVTEKAVYTEKLWR